MTIEEHIKEELATKTSELTEVVKSIIRADQEIADTEQAQKKYSQTDSTGFVNPTMDLMLAIETVHTSQLDSRKPLLNNYEGLNSRINILKKALAVFY